MEKYYLILKSRLVQAVFPEGSMLAAEAYEFRDGYWVKIDVNEVNDRLMGYDPTESDSAWALGNTEIMEEIENLSEEEYETELRKQFDKLKFIFTLDEVLLLKAFAAGMAEAYAESSEEERGDIPFIYYKDKKVINPWMNEDGTFEVNPFEYYGKEILEEQLINLGLSIDPIRSPEEAKVIFEKCERSAEPKIMAAYKEEVTFAMSEEQAREEGHPIAFGPHLPNERSIYYALSKIPAELATYEGDGWEEKISFTKDKAEQVLDFLYPEGIPFDFERWINRIHGEICWLIGFGD